MRSSISSLARMPETAARTMIVAVRTIPISASAWIRCRGRVHGNVLAPLKAMEADLARLEQVVVIVSPESPVFSDPGLGEEFLRLAEEMQVDVLLKPVNRFNLNDVLTPAEDGSSRH